MRSMRRAAPLRVAVLVAAVLLATAEPSAPLRLDGVGAPSATTSITVTPTTAIKMGAYAPNGDAGQTATVHGRHQRLGHRTQLQLTYYDWTDPFPDFGEHKIIAHHRTPVMAWYGPTASDGRADALAAINSGHYDALIARQAHAIKHFGHHIYLRPLIEMNGNWYRSYSQRPHEFVRAWRRIWRIFHRIGAENVTWVWCPNLTPSVWDPYYPGDHYVDVIGVDGYRTRSNGQTGASFAAMFGGFLHHFAGRKPLMLAEIGADPTGGDTATFIDGMRTYLAGTGRRQGVIAVCWFDTVDGKHDFRLAQTAATWRAWQRLAADPAFG